VPLIERAVILTLAEYRFSAGLTGRVVTAGVGIG
jgi:hypothetical protein